MRHNWVFVGTESTDRGFYMRYNCANIGCNLWTRILISKGIEPHVWKFMINASMKKADELTEEKYGCPYVATTKNQSTKDSVD